MNIRGFHKYVTERHNYMVVLLLPISSPHRHTQTCTPSYKHMCMFSGVLRRELQELRARIGAFILMRMHTHVQYAWVPLKFLRERKIARGCGSGNQKHSSARKCERKADRYELEWEANAGDWSQVVLSFCTDQHPGEKVFVGWSGFARPPSCDRFHAPDQTVSSRCSLLSLFSFYIRIHLFLRVSAHIQLHPCTCVFLSRFSSCNLPSRSTTSRNPLSRGPSPPRAPPTPDLPLTLYSTTHNITNKIQTPPRNSPPIKTLSYDHVGLLFLSFCFCLLWLPSPSLGVAQHFFSLCLLVPLLLRSLDIFFIYFSFSIPRWRNEGGCVLLLNILRYKKMRNLLSLSLIFDPLGWSSTYYVRRKS